MFKKLIGLVFLFCFTFSLSVEARQSSTRDPSTASKKIRPTTRKKRDATVVRKRRQRVSRTRNRPQRVTRARTRSQRVSRVRTRSQRVSRARARPQLNRRRAPQPVPIQLPPPPPPPTYLSKLKPHTQRNAQLGGFDRLYNKNLYGQAQESGRTNIAAVIEYSGEWGEIHSIKGGWYGTLSPDIRENYNRNFLTPKGDPVEGRLHPDARTRNSRISSHASEVASVILDLSPNAQVQPFSTYYCPHSRQQYDVATVLKRLCLPEWDKVRVINISAGHVHVALKHRQNADGTRSSKEFYPRLVKYFKKVAAAGKIVVFGAGNDTENIQPPAYLPEGTKSQDRVIGYLLKKLKQDPETQKSIIIAGALEPTTNTLSTYSNRAGTWAEAQERFLCASGDYEFAYKPEAAAGTSLAAPTITAALLDLLSIPGVTPLRAAKALLETADKGLDPTLYGKGRMNAARAAEWLEAGNY